MQEARSPMNSQSPCGARAAAALFLLALPLVLSSPAAAQGGGGGGAALGGVGMTDTITARARVKAVDLKNRTVTLVGPENNTFTVKAGEEVRNLPQVKPG